MKLGIYGGTFDPIHHGHLIVAELAREACALDLVWLVPAGSPPHKRQPIAPAADRVEMARIATAGHPAFEVVEHDVRRPGPHYTVDLLELIRSERPDDDLWFLIGADNLRDLPNWREPRRIADLATLVVINRPGVDLIAPRLDLERTFGSTPNPVRFAFVEIPPIGIASRDLRERLAQDRSVRYQVPRGVEAYIAAQRLYRNP